MSEMQRGLYHAMFFISSFTVIGCLFAMIIVGPQDLNSATTITIMIIASLGLSGQYMTTYRLGCWDVHISEFHKFKNSVYRSLVLKPIDEEKKID